MANRIELLQEAQRRGLPIPDRDRELLEEAQRRGLVPAPAPANFSQVSGSATSTEGPPAQPSRLQAEWRGVGLSARSALQGVGGIVGAIGGDAFNKLLPGDQPSYRDAAGTLADRIGLPAPQTGRERVLGDVGEALAGTATTMGAGAGMNALARLGGAGAVSGAGQGVARNRLAEFLTSAPAAQVAGAAAGAGASSMARESGASPLVQAGVGLAAGLAPGVVPAAAQAGVRGAVRGASPDRVRQNLNAFESIGTTPTVGQATESWGARGFETMLGRSPGGAGVMARKGTRQAEEIGEAVEGVANRLAQRSDPERAGRAIERGVETFANNTKAMRRALYWQADQFIPAGTAMPLANTQRALGDLASPTPGAVATSQRLINPQIRAMAQDVATDLAAGGGSMPYAAVRQLRERIGAELSQFTLSPDRPVREYRRLYAALSQDLEEAARQMGPEAERAARRANNYTRVSADRLEQVQRVVGRQGGPEAVYNAALSGTRHGGTTLRAVMQSLPREGQEMVSSAVIRRMGLATPGVQDAAGEAFSPQTFLTNWNRMSPEAKRALFDRYGKGFSDDVDRIARVAQNLREGSRVLANPSGSGGAISQWLSAGGAVVALLTGQWGVAGGIGAVAAASNGAARLMQSPAAVRWLARATELPVGALPAQLTTLSKIAEEEGDDELGELADLISQEVGAGPGLGVGHITQPMPGSPEPSRTQPQ